MTLMAVRNWGKLLALVEVNYCRLFDLHCPLHPIFTTSVPPFPIYQLAKLPLLQALTVAACCFLLWETGKYHSKASNQPPGYGRYVLCKLERGYRSLVKRAMMTSYWRSIWWDLVISTPSETFPNSNAARQEDGKADNPLAMLKSPGPPSFQ